MKTLFLRCFKVWFFSFFRTFCFSLSIFRWKWDSYAIHVVMLFLEHIIGKKISKINWKNLEKLQFYTKFTKSYICCILFGFFSKHQNIAFMYLVRSEILRWCQNWFYFWYATKTLDSGVKYASYFMHIPIFPIYWTNTYITYFTQESSKKKCNICKIL